jgi:hypothetical protein
VIKEPGTAKAVEVEVRQNSTSRELPRSRPAFSRSRQLSRPVLEINAAVEVKVKAAIEVKTAIKVKAATKVKTATTQLDNLITVTLDNDTQDNNKQ